MAAPQPHKTISCQAVLADKNCTHGGWLRKRTAVHDKVQFVNKIIPWSRMYVVLSQGCVYLFSSDTSSKPYHPFSLYGYDRVLQAGDILQKDVPWPFKLEPVRREGFHLKTRYFSAGSEREQKIWMTEFKKQMMFANGKGLKISHRENSLDRRCSSISSLDHGDAASISLSEVEGRVYTDASEFRPNPNHQDDSGVGFVPSDSDSGEDYEKITEDEDLKRIQSIGERERMPLPPTPTERTGRTRVLPPTPTADPGRRPPMPDPRDTANNAPPVRPPPDPGDHSPDNSPPSSPAPTVAKALSKLSRGDDDSRHSNGITHNKPGTAAKPKKLDLQKIGGINVMICGGPSTIGGNIKKETSPSPVTSPPVSKALPSPPPVSKALPSPPPARDRPLPVPPSRNKLPVPRSKSHSNGTVFDGYTEDEFVASIFCPDVDKDEANQLLSDRQEEGMYLLRASGTGGEYVLVVYADRAARKYRVSKTEVGEVFLEKDDKFPNILKLIQYYHSNDIPLRKTKLVRPYQK